MKKRILSVICSLALVLGMIVPWSVQADAATVTETTCACGATNVTWETLTKSSAMENGKHYRLSGYTECSQYVMQTNNITVCVDLAGHTLKSPTNRVFLVGYNSATGNVLNIMDSSSNKTGQIIGGSYGNGSGGVIYSYGGGTINVYGGTISNCATEAIKYGGIFQLNGGTLNMYGGKILGGKASVQGGAVNLNSKTATFNMFGGSIEGGTAPIGGCVYVASDAKIKLSNNASIEEIFFAGTPSSSLTIQNTYTGTVGLKTTSLFASGNKVAVSDNANISGAKISAVGQDRLSAVASGSNIVIGNFGYCEACKQTVQWTEVDNAGMNELAAASGNVAPGHYYLTEDANVTKQLVMKQSGTVCLDLAGHTMSNNRIMLGSSDKVEQTLSIQDSSAKKTGVVQARTSTGTAGSVFYMYSNTILNLYGGTYQVHEGTAKYAGIINVRTGATVNVYGGKIIGCEVSEYGSAIDVWNNGVLNLAGGEIISGKATQYADCVCVDSGGIVSLSGDAYVEELYFAGSSADKLTVSGTFTGKANLAFKTAPKEGADVGNCIDAVIGKENITIVNPRMNTAISGTNLVATILTGVSRTEKNGTVSYFGTLEGALQDRTSGSVIKLLADNSENVTIEGNATLDLFGWDLSGAINVSGTLYLKDSATDDFNTEDAAGLGVVTGEITGNVEACKSYVAIADETGTTYHKYLAKITKVSLRPGATGMYYTAGIKADEALQAKIDRFGLAVSLNKNPTADPADAASKYTAYGKEDYTNGEAKSALIEAVMETTNAPEQNTAYAATDVYGRPYILYTDATGSHYLYGDAYATNLQALTEKIEETSWERLTLTQAKAITDMYDAYKTEIADWNLLSVAKATAAANDKCLKVLIIGNSHGLDSTHLLREVFKAEGYITEEQNVILGALYIGGCRVSRHVSNLTQNAAAYDYYKNDGSKADGTWSIRGNATMLYALQDEDWDVVLLQEMNTASGFPEESSEFVHNNNNIETVYTYVTRNLGYEPKLMWNMIWANPEIPQDYMNIALGKESDDGEYVDPETQGGTGGEADELAAAIATWTFGPGPTALGSRISWCQNYDKYWQNDRQKMYDGIVENLKDYILANPVLEFTEADVMPAATAVQYALTQCEMTENGSAHSGDPTTGLYRDYTHISDFGRVMVSYLWYAKLTGKTEITDLNYTTVSKAMRHSKFTSQGEMVLTEDQIQAIVDSVNHALKNPCALPNS